LPPSFKKVVRRPAIVVVGSSNTDMIIRVPRIPKPGETLLGGEFLTAAGGKGANQAVAAARAGGRVAFVARVGRDSLGDQALDGYRHAAIDVRHVYRDGAAPSGVALIFVAHTGENSIAVAGGANSKLSAADVGKAAGVIGSAAILVMQLETPLAAVRRAAAIASRAKVPVILNPAPACELPDALLKLISIMTPNETEAETLTGIRVDSDAAAAEACAALRARGVGAVVLTLGARGAFVDDGRTQRIVRGMRVKAVDSTAAGDVFNGALAVALGEGRTLLDAVQFANAAAALSVTKLGAQPSAPTRAAITAFLSKNTRA
jgi:ribokinase